VDLTVRPIFLAQGSGQEPTDRVRLPAGGFREFLQSANAHTRRSVEDSSDSVSQLMLTGALPLLSDLVYGRLEGSGEAERCFRREAERHTGMNPNTPGA
jgi:hypothetical protein